MVYVSVIGAARAWTTCSMGQPSNRLRHSMNNRGQIGISDLVGRVIRAYLKIKKRSLESLVNLSFRAAARNPYHKHVDHQLDFSLRSK